MKPVLFLLILGLFDLCNVQAGTIVAWGNPNNLQTNIPSDLTNVVALSTGDGHGLALLDNGTVRNWGSEYGGAGPVPPGLSNIIAIACGAHHCLALKNDGTLAAWKYFFDDYGQATVPAGLTNVIAIAAGGYHSLALRNDGTVIAFGRNTIGGLNYAESVVPPGLSNVVAIAAGYAQSMALRADGTVVYWGWQYSFFAPYPAGLSNVAAIATGYQHSLALQQNGNLIAWGAAALTNIPPGLTNIAAIACNQSHSLALQNGRVVAWGYNTYGQTNVPAGVTNGLAIAAGPEFSAALVGESLLRIIQSPRAVNAVAGETALFRCQFVGPPLFAQWYFNGTPLPGQTNGMLVRTPVTPAQGGSYHFVASNALGSVQSAPALLTVVPLQITLQPTNRSVFGGDSTTFQVQARNVGPFTYQWRYGQSDLPAATNAQLNLTNVTTSLAGDYSVVVSNQYGAVTSSLAQLEVVPITFNNQPTNRTIYSGENTTFTATVWKNGPFAYQWRFNTDDLPGQTSATLTLSNVTASQAGSYSVRATNPYGTAESSNALLTVVENPPLILTQPTNKFAWHLGNALLQVNATGSKPLYYQWRFNEIALPAATNATLALTNLTPNRSGNYSVVISNSIGTVISSNAPVRVIPLCFWGTGTGQFSPGVQTPPGLTNPVAIVANTTYGMALRSDYTVHGWGFFECPPILPTGLSNVISLAAGPLHALALRSNQTVLAWGCSSSGVTSVPLGLNNVTAVAASGTHSVALRSDGIVHAWGSSGPMNVPSGLRNVTAIAAGTDFILALQASGKLAAWGPSITIPTNIPVNLTNVVAIAAGKYHALALNSDGTVASWAKLTPSLDYGQTNIPAGLSNIVAIGAGARTSFAIRSDGAVTAWGLGNVGQTNLPAGLSNVVAVTGGDTHVIALINTNPLAIARQPLDTAVTNGSRVLLSVGIVANQPVTYQWRYNGQNIPDATNAWHVLPNFSAAQAGYFSVSGSNTDGTVTSRAALVQLTNQPPLILDHPVSCAVLNSQPLSLTVTAYGTPPLSYQWFKDNASVPGKTTPALLLTNLHRSDSGYYAVVVSNLFGTSLSTTAQVRVLVPQRWAAPIRQPDGSLLLTSGDSDGGFLSAANLPHFSVLTSTNLADWIPSPGTLSLSNGLLRLHDFSPTNTDSQRFYRIVEQP